MLFNILQKQTVEVKIAANAAMGIDPFGTICMILPVIANAGISWIRGMND